MMGFLARSASCPATSYGVAFGRIMKSLARSALCALITVPIRLGSPLGKSLDSSESRLFCLYLSFSRRNKKRKATCVSKSHNHGGFSKHMWLLGGIGVRYRGSRTYCADASAEAVVASAEPVAVASAEALGLSDGTGEADAVPGARRTIRHVPSW